MIPRIASTAIWRPKLDETFFAPVAYAPNCFCEVLLERALLAPEGSRPDLELLYFPSVDAPRPWTMASLRLTCVATVRDLVGRVRLVRVERDLRAALEVDAEIEAPHAERHRAGDQDQRPTSRTTRGGTS